MAKLTVGNGLSEYIAELSKIGDLESYLGKVVYQGASVVNKAIENELQNLPVDNSYASKDAPRTGIRAVEKEGLIRSYGIAKMRNDDGYINVKVGFDGYNAAGKANALIARSLISGTSFLKKNNFMMRAVMKSRAASEEAMKVTLDSQIENILKK